MSKKRAIERLENCVKHAGRWTDPAEFRKGQKAGYEHALSIVKQELEKS